MLILGHLRVQLFDGGDFRLLGLSYLDEDHGQGDESTLSHKVDLIICKRREKLKSLI